MRVEIRTLIDDIDSSDAVTTHYLTLDGRRVRLDLSAEHDAQLRETLAPWLTHGQPQRRPRRARPKTPQKAKTQRASAIRTWARSRGYAVSDLGPIPTRVLQAYASQFAS